MANFSSFHLFSRFYALLRTIAVHRGALLVLVAVFMLGCSSGGSPSATATCSAIKSCPDGLVCISEKGLCALSGPGSADPDLGMPRDLGMPADLAMSADLAMPPLGGPHVCPFDHFCWENTLPQPRTLNGIWGTGPSDLWAVGNGFLQ